MLVLKRKTGLPTMGDFVNEFFNGNSFVENNFDFVPSAKIKETENDYKLSLPLPGFKKEDINLSIEDKYLIVSSQVEKDDFKQSFENKYFIPEDVNLEQINAYMENGILNIVIGKYLEVPKTSKKIN